ncbi:MAG: ABC transporter substrate binding protein [Desulfobacterales bacterium]|nr:ABC transporter substrate binding protein [Desulfobacterales bacterium]MDD4072078.1 ABC transporter substrate binding protein [Desulfobacterales bacterium]MDD4391324.1 ABC transporter substrate binding protein [Desulfobacterales bacterium]
MPVKIHSSNMVARLFFVCLIQSVVLGLLSPHPAFAKPEKTVLILHSYHVNYKWTREVMSGIRSVLNKDGEPVELYVEYMDTKRITSPDYFKILRDLYKIKFADIHFDVIISVDNDAFDFLREYRDELLPKTPVVFCGVNYFSDMDLSGHDRFTGVCEQPNLRASIETVLRLHPDTRQIAVIMDRTKTGRKTYENMLKIIPEYQNAIKFTYFDNMDVVIEKIRNLPPKSIVLYTPFFRDASGTFFEYDRNLSIISEICRVPIYGITDFSLGDGIVGGLLISGQYQGASAAKIAARILSGESVQSIPVVKKSPNRYMFDYKQLHRFNIHVSDLPKGSIVINQPMSLFSEYKKTVWITVVCMTGLAITICILSFNVVQRKRAEAAAVQSRDLFSAAIKAIPIAFFSKDIQGRYGIVNDAFAKFIGIPDHQIAGKTVFECWPPADARIYQKKDTELMKTGGMQVYEHRLPHITKGPRDGIFIKACYHDADGNVAGLVASFLDITDQKEAELGIKKAHDQLELRVKDRTAELMNVNYRLKTEIEERKSVGQALQKSEAELRFLSCRLLTIQEEERKKIVRELHESIGQFLNFLIIGIMNVTGNIKNGEAAEASNSLHDLVPMIKEEVEKIRRMCCDLRPPIIDDLGLLTAMDWFCREFEKTCTKIHIDKYMDILESEVPDILKITIFRIFQEALNNILKHSQADFVSIRLIKTQKAVEFEIKDNGSGFAIDAKDSRKNSVKGIGLSSMKERTEFLGGAFSVDSTPGRGVTIRACWPNRLKGDDLPEETAFFKNENMRKVC